MESIIDEIANKYYGCYLYAKRYIKINCNFYFDYEEMLLWEYYLICKRISNKYNKDTNYKNLIISSLIKRMFQYYKRNKDKVESNYDDTLIHNVYDNISLNEMMCKKYPIVYDYLYNNLTVREIKNKYNISQTKFYKELNIFYNKEYSENKTDSE